MTRFAVIGAGMIGTIHARNIARHPDFALRYVIDQDFARASRLAGETGAQPNSSPEAALGDGAVDAVIVASSTSAHEEHVLACSKAGKPFICEKPVSDNLPGAVACVEAAARAGVVAAMGLNRRLDADMRELSERVRGGEIGTVESVHVVSRSSRCSRGHWRGRRRCTRPSPTECGPRRLRKRRSCPCATAAPSPWNGSGSRRPRARTRASVRFRLDGVRPNPYLLNPDSTPCPRSAMRFAWWSETDGCRLEPEGAIASSVTRTSPEP